MCGQGRRCARVVARGGAIAATAAAASTSNRTLTKMPSKHYPLSDFAIKTHTSVSCKHIFRHFTPRETLTCCAHVAGAATIKSHFERECRVHPAAGPCFHVTSHYKFRFGWHRLGAREPEPRRSRLRGYGREHANERDPQVGAYGETRTRGGRTVNHGILLFTTCARVLRRMISV